ncbi:hypothetical protein U3516DRAFT_670762 [Neocallimastix sp. 'constans']
MNFKNYVNYAKCSVNRSINQAYNVLRTSNDLLNYFDNSIIQLLKYTEQYLIYHERYNDNSKDLYISTLMLTVGNGIYGHIFAVNVPGPINGIGMNAAHLYQLDNEFVLLNKVLSKTNDYKIRIKISRVT